MEGLLHHLERKYLYSEYSVEGFQPDDKGNVPELFCVEYVLNHGRKSSLSPLGPAVRDGQSVSDMMYRFI